MNKMIPNAMLVVALAVTLSLLAVGQQPAPSQARRMSMDEMMQQCKKHCESTNAMLESLIREADAAKRSNEAPKMSAALDNTEQMASEMKKHMEMCMNMMSMMGNMMGQSQSRASNAARPAGQEQTARIAVTTNGFEPSSINLRPNVPAKLTFIRQTDQTCAKSVVIPEYKINQEPPLNKPVVVTFTPTKTGEFGFACGMNMLKGKVVVRENG